jgi:hypothetical protein
MDGSVTNLDPTIFTIARFDLSPRTLSSGIVAFTVLTARFNSATNQIALAWNGQTPATNGTAIFYASFNPDTVTTSNTPLSYQTIDAFGDQYHPALDSDDAGWVLLAYHSNQNDPENRRYQLYGVAIAPWGIYTPSPLESDTHPPTPWPGDYFGNYYWTSLDASGSRWNVLNSPAWPTVCFGCFPTLKYTGVK